MCCVQRKGARWWAGELEEPSAEDAHARATLVALSLCTATEEFPQAPGSTMVRQACSKQGVCRHLVVGCLPWTRCPGLGCAALGFCGPCAVRSHPGSAALPALPPGHAAARQEGHVDAYLWYWQAGRRGTLCFAAHARSGLCAPACSYTADACAMSTCGYRQHVERMRHSLPRGALCAQQAAMFQRRERTWSSNSRMRCCSGLNAVGACGDACSSWLAAVPAGGCPCSAPS